MIEQVMGYTVASYNRLASILESGLNFKYANTGYYLFPALSYIPIFHNLLPDFFGVSGSVAVTKQEFIDVSNSGLNSAYIWATLYGYIANTLRWASPIYFLLLGFFIGILWKKFINNQIFGIILYPWAYACLLLIFASNLLFMPVFISFIYGIIIMVLWNSTFCIHKISTYKRKKGRDIQCN